MAIKVSKLIEKLNEKCNPDDEVECAICTSDGKVIVIDIIENARELKKLLEMFK